jgi:hypothetical protein
LWISLLSVAIAVGSFWNSYRQRRIAERQHATAERQHATAQAQHATSEAVRRIAEAQHETAEGARRIAAERLRHDLFSRRLQVREHVLEVIGPHSMRSFKEVDHKLVMALHEDARVADFIFGDAVTRFIDTLLIAVGERKRVVNGNGSAAELSPESRQAQEEELRLNILAMRDQVPALFDD